MILHLTDFTSEMLQSLAKFHALCIGMRRQESELFHSKVVPFVEAVNMITDDDDTRMVDVNIRTHPKGILFEYLTNYPFFYSN